VKDTMTERSPSTETIRFVIEILSARVTPIAELPQTIANITQAVAQLGVAPRADSALPVPMPVLRPAAKPPVRQARPKPLVARKKPAAVAVVVEAPAAPPRRRGRPRRVDVAPVIEAPAVEVAPPQPRLLRRAEALANETEHHGDSAPTFRTPGGTLRGVVKWFDGRAGKGALRLVGISGDVPLDPIVLTESGIKRLYKDQEVEATVQDAGGRVRLLSLSLPTRQAEPTLNRTAGEITGTVRRQLRSVQVEIKRDGIRRSAARAEAEQVLGGVGRIKVSRRLTP
jgi:cold shock CspA family protein